MELIDKVRLIIGNKCESAAQFADEIEIPRSAVSHLLNGRNRPSLDVIRKIIKKYPDLGTDWVWDDDTMPVLDSVSKRSSTGTEQVDQPATDRIRNPSDLFSQSADGQSPVRENVSVIKQATKRVERVLLFFSDGTFEEYT